MNITISGYENMDVVAQLIRDLLVVNGLTVKNEDNDNCIKLTLNQLDEEIAYFKKNNEVFSFKIEKKELPIKERKSPPPSNVSAGGLGRGLFINAPPRHDFRWQQLNFAAPVVIPVAQEAVAINPQEVLDEAPAIPQNNRPAAPWMDGFNEIDF